MTTNRDQRRKTIKKVITIIISVVRATTFGLLFPVIGSATGGSAPAILLRAGTLALFWVVTGFESSTRLVSGGGKERKKAANGFHVRGLSGSKVVVSIISKLREGCAIFGA
jgi:hypothetical protein